MQTATTKTLRPDKKGRITLGTLLNGASSFRAFTDEKGRIVLDPKVEVSPREVAFWKDKKLVAAVQQGLKDAAAGRLYDLGSFAKYMNESDE